MTDRRAVVTGLGVVSPVGIGVEATWDALTAGRSGIDRITLFDPSPFEVDVAGEVTHPLQLADHAQRRDDRPQLAGHR